MTDALTLQGGGEVPAEEKGNAFSSVSILACVHSNASYFLCYNR